MVKMYVSTFGRKVKWEDGIPIEVGAALRNNCHYELRDDQGDNISEDNPYYGELTGLYYIWKNLEFDEADIVGYCHYNKRLNISFEDVMKYFSFSPMNKEGTRWIVMKQVHMPCHAYPEDTTVLLDVLREYYPDYYDAWERVFDASGEGYCSSGQMFYTTAEELDKYCTFLFGVLEKVRNRIGNVDREAYHKRYCAFFGERLTNVYYAADPNSHVLYIERENAGRNKKKQIVKEIATFVLPKKLYDKALNLLKKKTGRIYVGSYKGK